jgi:hypothetical protein
MSGGIDAPPTPSGTAAVSTPPAPPFPLVAEPHQALRDPLAVVIRAYDHAIGACEAFDEGRAQSALGVLRDALALDTPASRSFDALYAWCEGAVGRRDYLGAAQRLRALRDAWRRATAPEPGELARMRPLGYLC